MKYQTLIIDDEPAARKAIRHYLLEEKTIQVIGEADNGEDALILIKEKKPDLIFLDIQMPELNGFEVLQQLEKEELPIVIFITAFDQYAIKAFEFCALDYLLKPFTKERFRTTLSRAKQMLLKNSSTTDIAQLLRTMLTEQKKYLQKLPIKAKQKIKFLEVKDIIWIESEGKFCKLYLQDGYKVINRTLKVLSEQLDPQIFIRTHKSYILNLTYVDTIEPYFRGEYHISLKNGEKLKMSRGYKFQLEKLLNQYQ